MASFFCQNCNSASSKWIGRCPSCNEWNTYIEKEVRIENDFHPVYKLPELLVKRKAEIADEEEANRKDKENYNSAIILGILGAFIGAVGGLIVFFLVGLVIAIIVGIHNLFAQNEWFRSKSNESDFYITVMILCIIICSIIGYIVQFNAKRIKKKDEH